ncbi:MAG: bifunctional serine/threonine-protein kinase/formylglycine-generating enzyme family protein [Planctomycetota bacterium]
MPNPASKTRSEDCIEESLLQDWLEERASLTESQIAHIGACPKCSSHLERASDIPEYSEALRNLQDSDSKHPRPFEKEDAFQSLRIRVLNLSHDDSTQPTRSQSTSQRPTQASDEGLLKHLQNQLAQDRYVLSRVLGRGATSVVVLAFDQKLSRDVAIKFLQSTDLATRERFRREADILKDAHHPNIVRIYEFDECQEIATTGIESGNALYIVMEYVAGGTSRELEFCQSFGFAAIARFFHGAAMGLQFAHAKNLVHRDVKPSNLLLDAQAETLKVSDFGLARSRQQDATQLTATGEILGTPEFMSPEHVMVGRDRHEGSSEVNEQSDIYSLGASLYAILTGSSPVRGSVAAILRQIPEVDPPRLTLINPAIPKPLEVICEKAMRKLPRDRYASMEHFANDLLSFANGVPIKAKPLNPYQQVVRWMRRYPALSAAIGSIIALVGIGLVAATFAAVSFRNQQNELLDERLAYREELCRRIASAAPAAVPLAIQQVQLSPAEFLPMLQSAWNRADDSKAKINLACSLACLNEPFERFLIDAVVAGEAEPGHTDAITMALATDRPNALERLHEAFVGTDDVFAKSLLAIHAARLNDVTLIATLATQSPDVRTRLVHLIPDWFGETTALVEAIQQSQDPDARFVLISGLGLSHAQSMDLVQLENIRTALSAIVETSPDTGVTSAAVWALRSLSLNEDDSLQAFDFRTPERLAANRTLGLRMISVRPGTFTMGGLHPFDENTGRTPHQVQISKRFHLSDREVSTAFFRAFLRDAELDDVFENWQPDEVISPSDSHPAQSVSWDQAAQFCNWLSRQHGFDPVYEALGELNLDLPDDQAWTGIQWKMNADQNGYRLPTEAEYEFACRAASDTLYSFGDSQEYFSHYVAWTNNTRVACQPCGQLMPNRWGFFDLHGNVWEWCEDWYIPLESSESRVDPVNLQPSTQGRAFRGGGVFTFTGYPYSSSRGTTMPHQRFSNVGFRIARTPYSEP